MTTLTTEAGRRWIYSIGIAVAAILTTYGHLAQTEVTVWLGLLSAILGGVAVTHVGERGIDQPRRSAAE